MGLLRNMFGKPRARSWDAARSNRLLNDWVTGGVISADQEIKADLLTLRDRSRDLVKNNSEAGRFVNLVAHNVIGHKGIQLQPRLLSRTGKPKPFETTSRSCGITSRTPHHVPPTSIFGEFACASKRL